MSARKCVLIGGACVLVLFLGTAETFAQKYGGVLKVMFRTNPPSLIIHEGSANDYTLPMMPVHNNLVLYKPEEQVERLDTIIPELAERWEWSADHRRLTFTLRKGVVWHDGKPFTSVDVKDTYDMARGAHASKRFRLNPRKSWWANVSEITTKGDYEVTFHIKRPQPSLLAMLASGQSPVLSAHHSPAELRVKSNGTGPFRLKAYNRDKNVLLEKNPDYWVKGRPYLDGVDYIVIKNRGTRLAAMMAGQLDVSYPTETDQKAHDTYKKAVPGMKFFRTTTNSRMEVLVNMKRAPFDNADVRRAVSLALDRDEFKKVIFSDSGIVGGVNLPPPFGSFGLARAELDKLPGFGNVAQNREKARTILAGLGYNASNPLKVKMHVRSTNVYVTMATWAMDQLKKVGIESELVQVETGTWFSQLARREFMMLLNTPAMAIDDPDANFAENFACGSERNYGDYCNPGMQKRFEQQSVEIDPAKRLVLVQAIERDLITDAPRAVLPWRIDFYAHWPHVKDFYPHNTIYNYFRLQNVWLDR